jgi:hypothetical protein
MYIHSVIFTLVVGACWQSRTQAAVKLLVQQRQVQFFLMLLPLLLMTFMPGAAVVLPSFTAPSVLCLVLLFLQH